jgi:hypothetical protein
MVMSGALAMAEGMGGTMTKAVAARKYAKSKFGRES